jgi:hypothetical protein
MACSSIELIAILYLAGNMVLMQLASVATSDYPIAKQRILQGIEYEEPPSQWA